MSFKSNLKSVGVAAALATALFSSTSYADCEPDPYMGSICITAIPYCPRQYVDLGFQNIESPAEYPALFSLMGDMYGGNGSTSFAYPYVGSRMIRSQGTGPGLYPVQQGMMYGWTHIAMDSLHLPAHNHTASFTPPAGGTLSVAPVKGNSAAPSASSYIAIPNINDTAANRYISNANAGQIVDLGGTSSMLVDPVVGPTLGETGGSSQGIPITPPQLALRFCMAVEGTYPPRP